MIDKRTTHTFAAPDEVVSIIEYPLMDTMESQVHIEPRFKELDIKSLMLSGSPDSTADLVMTTDDMVIAIKDIPDLYRLMEKALKDYTKGWESVWDFKDWERLKPAEEEPTKAWTEEELEGDRNTIFVQHVENHLKEGEIVICKICNKNIDEIYEEEGALK